MAFGVLPLLFPDGERLDQDAGLQQDVVGNVCQSEFRVEEVTSAPSQENRDIDVALGRTYAAKRARLDRPAQATSATSSFTLGTMRG